MRVELSNRLPQRRLSQRRRRLGFDLATSIEAERIDLVGNSMGGYFAMAFAIAHPERVQRLVLLGAPVGLDRGEIPLILRLMGNPITGPLSSESESLIRRPCEDRSTQALWPTRRQCRAKYSPWQSPPTPSREQTLPRTASMLRKVLNMRGIRPDIMLRSDMAQLPVPTLFAWGDTRRVRSIVQRTKPGPPNA
jgi:pimeloyl-ACP methyl ester carboxylesterase